MIDTDKVTAWINNVLRGAIVPKGSGWIARDDIMRAELRRRGARSVTRGMLEAGDMAEVVFVVVGARGIKVRVALASTTAPCGGDRYWVSTISTNGRERWAF